MVDTSCNVTIVNPAVIAKIDEAVRPVIETVENQIVTADGSSKAFLDRGMFDLEVSGKKE